MKKKYNNDKTILDEIQPINSAILNHPTVITKPKKGTRNPIKRIAPETIKGQ